MNNYNSYLVLRKDIVDEDTFMKLYNYVNNNYELDEDFENVYWKKNSSDIGNIFKIEGQKRGGNYISVKISVKDDKVLWPQMVSESKLNKHYKNLIDILYEPE